MDRIVVISDDADLRREISDGLGESECQWLPSEEVKLDAEAASEDLPDVILLDTRSPQGNGMLTQFADQAVGDIPVIVVGEYDDYQKWSADLEKGASDFLAVPFTSVELSVKVGVQVRVKRRLDQLKAEAVIDELTRGYNRRFMESQLVAKLGEAQRYHHPFSFLILDIDHFKQLNDNLGHQFGDLVLREGAALMRNLIRKEDILARYGGEEFAIILPYTDRTGAAVLGERVRKAIAEKIFEQGEKQAKITISIGAGTYPVDQVETVEALIACADKRLYQAKEAGRNRLVYE